MAKLSGKNLQQYLFHIRDLEASCYKQRRYIAHLNNLLNTANHPKILASEAHKKSDDGFGVILFSCLFAGFAGGIICGIIGAITGIITCIITDDNDIFSLILVIGIILGIVFGIICTLVFFATDKKNIKIANQKIDAKNDALALRNKQITISAHKQAEMLNIEISKAKQTLAKTNDILRKYYNQGVIYEKYRGLVPITMFCEYFASGRCNSLAGHEGAYNIYETEVRLNLIIVKLDDIISHLDQIKENQYMLSNLIQEGNREIQSLAKVASRQTAALQRIEDNTEAANYYNKITAANTSYLSWLAYQNQIHND